MNKKKSNGSKVLPKHTVVEQTFREVEVVLDYGKYQNCKFYDCIMTYYASGPISITGCQFLGCKWNFSGSASLTLDFLMNIYTQEGSGRELVESTFENIRKGRKNVL
ncbi:hypothetical protein [uncultured Algoriphagus sp.]|uniref:hypothetical protein n=1 Tax=uncultured Algoriphagus sp. TaxID=417365 RepID=UPI0030EDCC92|tara:strand:+ start:6913 stop:7233 length:321 start_codon:yes stop_codon:yes gene_type:complete